MGLFYIFHVCHFSLHSSFEYISSLSIFILIKAVLGAFFLLSSLLGLFVLTDFSYYGSFFLLCMPSFYWMLVICSFTWVNCWILLSSFKVLNFFWKAVTIGCLDTLRFVLML